MKIIHLRFKNLNSLYGEWSIDFTDPAYVSDGIFAITGPTGAGKTTILDAICLALYCRTPRLSRVTKTTNDIMSRQTGECATEVTFETREGTFRCHWSQHRARKKPDGELQMPRHELADAETGNILETKLRDVAGKVEILTGMDFDRFTRSMLLAQGGFAAFLQASADDRSPILEQITGTEIYSHISQRVHERQREEQAKLELIQAETAGISILGDEDETRLSRELEEMQKAEKNLRVRHDRLEKEIHWLDGIDALKKELLLIDGETTALNEELQAFHPQRQRLLNGLKAAELDSVYATITEKRTQQQQELDTLANAEKQLPDREKKLGVHELELKNAEEAVVKTRNDQKSKLEMIKQVRALDLRISDRQQQFESLKSEYRKMDIQLSGKKELHTRSTEKLTTVRSALSAVEAYLHANAADARLVGELTGITEQIKNRHLSINVVSTLDQQVSGLKKSLKAKNTRFAGREKLCLALSEKHKEITREMEKTRSAISTILGGRLLREYRMELDTLMREMAFLRNINDLETERSKLEDNSPCPLCGSLNHPYAEGNVPATDETEEKIKVLSRLIQKADDLDNDLKQHASDEKDAASALADAEKKLVRARFETEEASTSVMRAEMERQAAADKGFELHHGIAAKLDPFGIATSPGDNLDAILSGLGERLEKWQTHQRRKDDVGRQIGELEAELSGLDAVIKTLGEAFGKKKEAFDAQEKDLETLMRERTALYGKKNPDREETRLEKASAEAEASEKASRETRDRIKQGLNEHKARIDALKETTTRRKTELEREESVFADGYRKAGFEDEAKFISCRISAGERNDLAGREKRLDKKQADIAARQTDRETRLAQEINKKITDTPREDIMENRTAVAEALKVSGEQIGAVKQKLTDNTDAKLKYRDKRKLIEAQTSVNSRWDALHLIIGSADGKKYRNFAQGLTFELMVSHANRQLEKMTDRYLLIRDDHQPLALNVVDNYQAGEIRSTQNLSGGESFIVSLALALGLSHMASRKVSVDSLFLDEGFGTLDEEAMDIALETLAGLHQEGKLVGIISHVSMLKERISTRIHVTPQFGGKSAMTGPGCRQGDRM
ncbi:MAG: AAA family ATPase [Desulfobacteraceae bacterium]|nr:AAA family ATPase [Desulfobacteraceae bacterium]